MEKIRLDVFVKNKLNISRTQASRLISEGYVRKKGEVVTKASYPTDGEGIEIDKSGLSVYVGRGGYKLEKALEVFKIDLENKVCVDIGASTGGFTHCMLLRGARLIYSVDVGKGQLSEELIADRRVVSMEQTNILDIKGFETPPHFAAADVSFVSLTKILSKIYDLLSPFGQGVFLIKPQFEVGKGFVGKNGIVRDRRIHFRVLRDVLKFAEETGFGIRGVVPSPIRGGDGNIEYLMYVSKCAESGDFSDIRLKGIVRDAFTSLK